MMDNVQLFITLLISIFSVSISMYSLFISQRKTYIENVSKERMEWIKSMRSLLSEFAAEYYNPNKDQNKLNSIRFNILIYLRRDNTKHDDLIRLLNEIPSESNPSLDREYIDNITIASQIALTHAWKVYKNESFYSKKIQNSIRKLANE